MMRFTVLLCLWLPFAIAAKSTYTPCTQCDDKASPARLAQIKLTLYTGPTIDKSTTVLIGDAMEIYDKIDNSKPTVVYVFGCLGTSALPSTKAIINGYLTRGDHNILLLDWSNINHEKYSYVVASMDGVGYNLATVLNEYVARGLNTIGLHIVGHSLGAHVCGYTGSFVNFTLPKIIGLDPAGPTFKVPFDRLSADDAEFVVNIHSDIGAFGTNVEIGDVDFYPNGGYSVQPGCPIVPMVSNGCSHYRACYYYAATVPNKNALIGEACNSDSDFRAGLCNSNPKVAVGYGTPNTARGRYYLQADVRKLNVKVGDDVTPFLLQAVPLMVSADLGAFVFSLDEIHLKSLLGLPQDPVPN